MSLSIKDKLKTKIALYEHCQQYIQSLLADARRGIDESRAAANLEEKSSAGDKFETHRAMMHLQMESFIKRRRVAEDQETQLLSLQIKSMSHVQLGALVTTDQRNYFIAVSAPAVVIDGTSYICLSTAAPLFLAMRGLSAEDWIEWGDDEEGIEILSIH